MIGETITHYRIVAQIGAGGMGIVYRAHDEQLQREVAIKVLPPGSLADDAARRQFRKEALSLARLNHPNVATIFEFASENGRDFLVTEFIPGVTLSEKLAAGPLDTAEVVRLGIQLALGLGAAHAQGLVHRDLKPGNIRLTTDGRLKILDFGLAQAVAHASDFGDTATLTKTYELAGTLPYMAPEQLRGAPADVRSDLWAAGAVLYEMATGKRAFPEDTTAILIDGILNKPPTPPTRFNQKIPAELNRVITKALQKQSSQRYQTAAELSADLERLSAGSTAARSPGFRGLLLAAGILVLVIALVLGGIFWRRKFHVTGSTVPHRRSVAVLGFKNLAGNQDQAWLSTALSEMLTTELAAGGKLRTIPGENVATAKSDMKLPDAPSLAASTLTKLNRILGADVVVLGSYLSMGGQLRVDVRVEETNGGETVGEFSETGTEAKLFDLVRQLGVAVREKCGTEPITTEEAGFIRSSEPQNLQAARLYSEGLEKLRSFDFVPARDLLSQAIAADPNFALAHEALAEVWSQLGYDDRAQQESKRGYDLSANLAHTETLAIEARYREDSHDWNKAVEIYRSLWTVFPDNPEYGLRLASALTNAGNGQEALGIVDRLRQQLASPMRDDPRIDLAEAEAARSLSDYHRDATASETAITKAAQRGSEGLRAEALLQECWALRNLGDPERAKIEGQQAGDILAGVGDLRGQARSLTCVGDVLADQGQLSRAKAMHEHALELAQKIGAEKDVAGARINLGNDLVSSNLNDSTEQYREALALALSVGDKPDALLAQDNLGANLETQGDFQGALRFFNDSVHTAEGIGDQAGIAEALINRSWISYLTGDLGGAKLDLQRVVDTARQLQLKSRVALALSNLGKVQMAEDQLAKAQSSFEESLRLRNELGEKGGIADSQLSLAALALENKQAELAASLASGADHEFETENDADQRTAAQDLLTQAWLEKGQFSDAAHAISIAKQLQSHDLLTTMSLQITAAKLLGKTGQPGQAGRELQQIESQATQKGLVAMAWQATLALAETEIQSGKVSAARNHLQTVQRDASQKGYRLFARKASELQNSLN